MPGRFFTTAEHDQRIAAVRSRMAKAGLDLLVEEEFTTLQLVGTLTNDDLKVAQHP